MAKWLEKKNRAKNLSKYSNICPAHWWESICQMSLVPIVLGIRHIEF